MASNDNQPMFQLPSLEAFQKGQKDAQAAQVSGLLNKKVLNSGYDFARALGYKGAEERKVETANKVMADAAMGVQETDPLKRQFNVLAKAAEGFSKIGMYDYVQQIAPELARLKNQQLEQSKLLADAEHTRAETIKTDLESQYDKATLQSRVKEAAAVAESAGLNPNSYWDPSDPNPETMWHTVNDKDSKEVAEAKANNWVPAKVVLQAANAGDLGMPRGKAADVLIDARKAANAGADYVGQLADLKQQVIADPKVFTNLGGPVFKTLETMGTEAKALMSNAGIDDLLETAEGDNAGSIIAKGLRRKGAENSVLDLAYARARTRDPGGRLSNQDVEMAVRVFNAGDSLQLMNELDRQAKLVSREIKNHYSSNNLPLDDAGYTTFAQALGHYSGIQTPKQQTGDSQQAPMAYPNDPVKQAQFAQYWAETHGK